MINGYEIIKGDIYYANLNPVIGSEQGGKRPVVVIQNNFGNKFSPTVVVAPVTNLMNHKPNLPTHIKIEAFSKVKYDSIVLIEQVRVIDKKRLRSYLGRLNSQQLQKIDKALIHEFNIQLK